MTLTFDPQKAKVIPHTLATKSRSDVSWFKRMGMTDHIIFPAHTVEQLTTIHYNILTLLALPPTVLDQACRT